MRPLALLIVAVALAACDSGPGPGPTCPGDPRCPDPSDSLVVEGVNLTRLFAAPTGAEQSAVRAGWAARDAGLFARYRYEVLGERAAPDGATLRLYAGHDVETDSVLHYGLVRLPLRSPGDQTRRPVLLVAPYGEGDPAHAPPLEVLGRLPILPTERERYVYAVLAYRGETLVVDGETFAPAAPRSPYDRDVDDALAFLEAVRTAEPLVDPARVGALGLGRGGTVALLAAERANPFDAAVSLAAPTDFFLPSVRQDVARLLRGQAGPSIPGLAAVVEAAVRPLATGETSYAAARLALLRRSPAPFASPPPFLIVAHGALDGVVPVDHGRALFGVVGTTEALYLEEPNADHDDLVDVATLRATVTTLLRQYVDGE